MFRFKRKKAVYVGMDRQELRFLVGVLKSASSSVISYRVGVDDEFDAEVDDATCEYIKKRINNIREKLECILNMATNNPDDKKTA